MASFETFPKIKIRLEDVTEPTLFGFYEAFKADGQWMLHGEQRCVVLFDVDDAERAVAWLKEHGVEQGR